MTDIHRLLKDNGYELVRRNKHEVWRDTKTNVQLYVAQTPRVPSFVLKKIKRQIKQIKEGRQVT